MPHTVIFDQKSAVIPADLFLKQNTAVVHAAFDENLLVYSLTEHPDVYSLVFGESVLNDAIAIVLYGSIDRFRSTDACVASQAHRTSPPPHRAHCVIGRATSSVYLRA